MLRLGFHLRENRTLLTLNPRDMLCHTAIMGQSGSGKSYLVARLVEEIVLRTRARIIIVDPNGDFRSIADSSGEEIWSDPKHHEILSFLDGIESVSSYDEQHKFNGIWNNIVVQSLVYRRSPPWGQINPDSRSLEGKRGLVDESAIETNEFRAGSRSRLASTKSDAVSNQSIEFNLPDNEGFRRDAKAFLCIHWGKIRDDQDFLLHIDPITQPRVYLACHVCRVDLESQPQYQHGYGLRELEESALTFASDRAKRNRTLQGSLLGEDDYMSFQGLVAELRSRFTSLYDSDMENADWAPTDLSGFIHRGFIQQLDSWRVCAVDISGAPRQDSLLSVNVLLGSLLREAKYQWQRIVDSRTRSDKRVPTFIVLDEAHRFAPSETEDRLQRRVSERITEIAAEGRKYGLFLILATQRPDKLKRGLLEECENSCLLRIQSKRERSVAAGALGLPEEVIDQVASLRSGEGLVSGRWIPAPSIIRFAPARIRVGGGNLNSNYWIEGADQQPQLDLFSVFKAAVDKVNKKRINQKDNDSMNKVKSIIHALEGHYNGKEAVVERGILGQTIGELLSRILPDLTPIRYGFVKLTELMQYCCRDTKLCMFSFSQNEVVLGYRDSPPEGAVQLPDLEPRNPNSVEFYRSILATGLPIIRPPSVEVMRATAQFLLRARPIGESLSGLIEKGIQETTISEQVTEIKSALLCFVACDCFDRAPVDVRLAEQALTFRESITTIEEISTRLRNTIVNKLKNKIGDINEEILNAVIVDMVPA